MIKNGQNCATLLRFLEDYDLIFLKDLKKLVRRIEITCLDETAEPLVWSLKLELTLHVGGGFGAKGSSSLITLGLVRRAPVGFGLMGL